MVNENKEFDIFVGTRIGSFKHVKYFVDSSKNSKKNGENLQDIKTLTKDDAITSMCWGDDEQTEILIGRKNQQIQMYSTTTGSFTKTITADFGKGNIIGLGKLRESNKTDLVYDLLRSVSLSFYITRARSTASCRPPVAADLSTIFPRHEQKEFKGDDARLTAAAATRPRAPRRALQRELGELYS
ncbi:hypothetical protein EVAR_67919_1 [Eumeta japonica]|uniref:Uncharacterized protein n=1 Tax=Eumeta variegata TaxID=151549 RepID=A0A4C1ZPE4_EUMVA|nr:hypothetical protein EVAR_67919_1 [Eumeta japonica]